MEQVLMLNAHQNADLIDSLVLLSLAELGQVDHLHHQDFLGLLVLHLEDDSERSAPDLLELLVLSPFVHWLFKFGCLNYLLFVF